MVTCLDRKQRQHLIEWQSGELSISAQAQLLGLNRTSLYYQPVPVSEQELALKHRIDEVYIAYPFYGSRKITEQLRREGHMVNRKAVRRHMREMGLCAIYPGPNLSKRAHQAAIHPYLLRNVTASYPNHVWGLDITSIRFLVS